MKSGAHGQMLFPPRDALQVVTAAPPAAACFGCLASHISGPQVTAESCLQFPLWSRFSEPQYKRCHRALQLSSPVFPKFLLTRWFILVFQPPLLAWNQLHIFDLLHVSSNNRGTNSCGHNLCNIVGSAAELNSFCIKTQKSSCTTSVKPFDSKLNVWTLSSELKST